MIETIRNCPFGALAALLLIGLCIVIGLGVLSIALQVGAQVLIWVLNAACWLVPKLDGGVIAFLRMLGR